MGADAGAGALAAAGHFQLIFLFAATEGIVGPAPTHAVLYLQTSRALHAILPETLVLRVDFISGQVPSCV